MRIYFRKKNQVFLFLWLLIFGIFLFAGNVVAGEIPSYEIKASINTAQKKITASQVVTFTNNSSTATDALYFHIYPNRQYTRQEINFMLSYAGYFKINPFPGGFTQGSLDVRSVTADEKPLSFIVEGEDKTLLKIPLGEALEPGATIKVLMDFSVSIPHAYGRFGWHENIFALSRWYPILSVHNEQGWNNHPFYPFHRPFFSEAASYKVELAIPAEQKVIHSGDLIDEESVDSKTKTLSIQTSLPIRDFSLSMSQDYQMLAGENDGVQVKSFYLPGNEYHAKEALQDATALMSYYSKLFGKYPYKTFSIAPVYLGYGGEQMSNMVFIDTRVYQLPKLLNRYFDFLISHETGHQWFYNIMGSDEFTQMWLEEGTNSYFLLEYLENKYGPEANIVEFPKPLSWLLPEASFRGTRDYRYKIIARTKFDHPVVGKLSGFHEPSSIFSITYGKGSAIVSMLRSLIGDEAFYRVFARIFEQFQFKNFSTRGLIDICREETGRDLTSFFDAWLTTSEKCDYAVAGVQGDKIFLENRGDIAMPVDIEIEFADGKKSRLTWDGASKKEKLSAGEITTVKSIVLDPDKKLLDIDRTNNSWPRRVSAKAVPLYHGLYDIPLFLPEDSYNFVVGPELANGGVGLKASFQKPFDYNFYSASDYDINDKLIKSRLGFKLSQVANSLATAGFELFNTDDLDTGEEDLAGGKIYFRQELRPASYSLSDINEHVTFYLLRNRSLDGGAIFTDREDSRNNSYLKKDEAIIGAALHLQKAAPFPDPKQGYRLDAGFENSGHFLGATQYFYRSFMDTSFYKPAWPVGRPVTAQSKLAARFKYGWGYPDDKNLYELGGFDGLRGYGRKTLRGAQMVLTSLEYRFPIIEKMNARFFDNILGVESMSGVVFADGGQSWFDDFNEAQLKKDAGLGLRLTVNIGSFLEKVLVRLDVAQAIHEPKEETHFWFGINQAF